MHDQRKSEQVAPNEEQRTLELTRISEFRSLYAAGFAVRASSDLSTIDESLTVTAKLLQVNPELYSMFNFRRELLLKRREALSYDEYRTLMLKELEANTKTVTKDHKCYAAWLHRRWILQQVDENTRLEILTAELKKCESLLKVDERNFHCWGYRNSVTKQLGSNYGYSQELTFTGAKIAQNFSNYSAWHYRAAALTAAKKALTPEEFRTLLSEETELMLRAMYCDPNDQSAWFFAKWVLNELRTLDDDTRQSVISKILHACEELVEDEPLKFPLLAIAELAETSRRLSALETLRTLDPMRAGVYWSMQQKLVPTP